jgi:hypothetical protein
MMSAFEKVEHTRNLARIRQKKYYDAHKAEISIKKKGEWKTMMEEATLQGMQFQTPAIEFVGNENDMIEDDDEDIVILVKKKKSSKGNVKHIINFEYIKTKLDSLEIAAGTRKKYLDDAKTLLRITGCTNLTICLKRSDEIIQEIENAKQMKDPSKVYSINTKKGLFQTIVYLIDKLEIPLSAKLKATYVEQFDKYKIESNNEDRNKGQNEKVINFNTIISRIKDTFGEDSKQYLLIKLYDTLTCRDNFVNLQIIESKSKVQLNQNYIVVPKSKASVCVIVLQVYKTSKKNNKIEETCSKEVSALIRSFVTKNELKYNDMLLGQSKLTGFIGLAFKKIGISSGAINYIRTSKLSTELDGANINDAALRLQYAKKSQHSPVTQLRYLRTLVE